MSAPLSEIRALALVNIQSNQNLLRVRQVTNKLSDRQRQFFHQRWRGNDLRFPGVEGPRSRMTRFINWYVGKLHRAAHHDAEVSVAFLKVVNLLAPPPSIMRPSIMWRVLQGNLKPGKQASSLGAGEPAVTFSSSR